MVFYYVSLFRALPMFSYPTPPTFIIIWTPYWYRRSNCVRFAFERVFFFSSKLSVVFMDVCCLSSLLYWACSLSCSSGCRHVWSTSVPRLCQNELSLWRCGHHSTKNQTINQSDVNQSINLESVSQSINRAVHCIMLELRHGSRILKN